MKTSKVCLLAAAALLAATTAKADVRNDRQGVEAACANDAETAGCSGERIGTGLQKCLGAYRKSHPEFRLSPDCASAERQMHTDRRAAGTNTNPNGYPNPNAGPGPAPGPAPGSDPQYGPPR